MQKMICMRSVLYLGSLLVLVFVFRGSSGGAERQTGGRGEEERGLGGVGNSHWASPTRWSEEREQQVKQLAKVRSNAAEREASRRNTIVRHLMWIRPRQIADGAVVWIKPVRTSTHTNIYKSDSRTLHPQIPPSALLEELPTLATGWCQLKGPFYSQSLRV